METNPFYDESFQPNDKWLIEIFAETWKYLFLFFLILFVFFVSFVV
ncbi:MAG: hypothetical protein JSV88_06705 [Candidatus Aminicenantes bacterium]|nr:MAG: hypothetical protein JSV88_06705 [Candidatus Aminicenantes bacterium]